MKPWAGRNTTKGRELWSSDLDRSGWHPGLVVEPVVIPVPELGPGSHTIELQIKDIRPKKTDDDDHGYWVVSAVVAADDPRPRDGALVPGHSVAERYWSGGPDGRM